MHATEGLDHLFLSDFFLFIKTFSAKYTIIHISHMFT